MQNRSIVETNLLLRTLYPYFEIWRQRSRRQVRATQRGTNNLSTNSFKLDTTSGRYDYLKNPGGWAKLLNWVIDEDFHDAGSTTWSA